MRIVQHIGSFLEILWIILQIGDWMGYVAKSNAEEKLLI